MRRRLWTSGDVSRAIGLLRAVNVGGRNALRMAALQSLLEALGYVEPRTLLQSGNVVFGFAPGVRAEGSADVEARIQRELQRRHSLESEVFVRSSAEWDEAIVANPFTAEARSDPSRLMMVALREPPSAASVKALQAAVRGPERIRAHDRQLYIVYPDGMGRSKLTGTVIERALGSPGTARNWNTVLKLAALAHATDTSRG